MKNELLTITVTVAGEQVEITTAEARRLVAEIHRELEWPREMVVARGKQPSHQFAVAHHSPPDKKDAQVYPSWPAPEWKIRPRQINTVESVRYRPVPILLDMPGDSSPVQPSKSESENVK